MLGTQKNEFESSMVNESSVFEPLKFYFLAILTVIIEIYEPGYTKYTHPIQNMSRGTACPTRVHVRAQD